jgi:hypothetical protein
MSAEQNDQQINELVLEMAEAVPPVSDAEKTSMLARIVRIRARVAVGDGIMTDAK